MGNYLEINSEYLYCCECNLIFNREMRKRFEKYSASLKIQRQNPPISVDDLKISARHIGQISFETTQNCDLKCRYCAYGGDYFHQRRTTDKMMSFDTARQGLDRIFKLIGDREEKRIAIAFYGGEPLLNFDLIKGIVEYSKVRFRDWQRSYFMTSNLTILKQKMIDLLMAERFYLSVSLDGPKEIHDANRMFPDRSGSFDTVINNLGRIKEADLEYFNSINFVAVYSPDLPFRKVYDFFSGDWLGRRNFVRLSTVGSYDTCYYEKFPFDKKKSGEDYRKVLDKIIDKIRNKRKLSPFEDNLLSRFNRLEGTLHRTAFSALAGTCLFDDKLFIDAEGNFHLCEKINHHFSTGDVYNGFDFERMAKMVGEYGRVIRDNCSDCDWFYLCERCFVIFAKGGKFQFDEKFCREQQARIKSKLAMYVTLKRKGVI